MPSQYSFQYLVRTLSGAILLVLVGGQVAAQTTWTSDPVAIETQQAAQARYEADRKLCADEPSPEARLQCRRDAQVVYDKALASLRTGSYSTKPVAVDCADCGKVTAVHVINKKGDSNAVGLIAGGVAGAVLGHQIGGGMGKDLATIAGAAGGAYAGKKVQENMNTTKVWQVSVTYTHGGSAKFDYAQDPGFKVGDPVKKSGNTLVRN